MPTILEKKSIGIVMMNKVGVNIFLCFFLAVVALLCSSCERSIGDKGINLRISETGQSTWEISLNKKTYKVESFLFPRSVGLEKVFKELLAEEEEAMAYAKKMKIEAPSLALRQDYEKEYIVRKEGEWPWRMVDSWPNYPIVVVIPVFKEENLDAVIVCRQTLKPCDIVFTMQSNKDTTCHDYLRVAKELTQRLDKTDMDANNLPLAAVPLYDEEGHPTRDGLPQKFQKFFKEEVFIKQH
jgi:hypothetical protein